MCIVLLIMANDTAASPNHSPHVQEVENKIHRKDKDKHSVCVCARVRVRLRFRGRVWKNRTF